MKNIILGLIIGLFLLGCSEKEPINVESNMVVGHSVETLKLNNQFEKPQTISADTTRLIFAFSKDMGHLSNDYFATQTPTYLADNHTVFIVNVSAAPSIIRSMFIMPSLKDLKHSVSIIEDETVAARYQIDAHVDELMVVDIDNYIIKNISFISTEDDLKKIF